MVTPILTKHHDDTVNYTIELRENSLIQSANYQEFNPRMKCNLDNGILE